MNYKDNSFVFNPIVPYDFIEEKKEYMLEMLLRLNRETGVRRVALVFPSWDGEAKGLLAEKAYEKFGDLLSEVGGILANEGIEAGWWCVPTLSLGPKITAFGSSEYDFQKITGIDGAVSKIANCPLDRNYRDLYVRYIQTVVSRARPPYIFFEDDYEVSNHDVVQFGCFCPLHLGRFCEMTGEQMTREDLEAIFRKNDDKAAKYRRIWAELMRDSLVELSSELRRAVDEIAPDTRMGLCQSGRCDFDGDFTESVAKALAGNTKPMVRLWGTDYNSDAANNFPGLTFHFLYSKQTLPEDFELLHESDPYPHSRFYFSSGKLRALLALAMIYGLDGSLLYITQYTDGPLEEKGYALMIKESRTFLEVLRNSVDGFRLNGPNVLYRPFAHVHREITGTHAPDMAFPAWASVLGRFGIPYAAQGGSGPAMVCGDHILELTHDEILNLMAKGMFLDGRAAEHLCRLGYSELLGVDVEQIKKSDGPQIQYERLTENSTWRGGTEGSQIYFIDLSSGLREYIGVYSLKPVKGGCVLSEFIDENGKAVAAAAALYENRLGGRIAVIGYDLERNTTASIYNYKRKEQFRGIIEWLGDKNLPVYVAGDPNVFVTALENPENGDKIAAIFNLCLDEIRRVQLFLDASWKRESTSYLKDNGVWEQIEDIEWKESGRNKFSIDISVGCKTLRPLVLRFADR